MQPFTLQLLQLIQVSLLEMVLLIILALVTKLIGFNKNYKEPCCNASEQVSDGNTKYFPTVLNLEAIN